MSTPIPGTSIDGHLSMSETGHRRSLGITVVGVVAVLGLAVALATDDGGEPDGPVISEVVSSTSITAVDGQVDPHDWIEIHNPTGDAIDLSGWRLADSDDPSTGWTFPPTSLDAGAYLVVFASGSGEVDPEGNLHTDFRIDQTGEPVVLARPDGATVDRMPPVTIPRNASFGRDHDDPDRTCYFAFPTPGSPNAPECFEDASLGAPTLSASTGFYDEAFDLEISPQTPGAAIIYTLDGSYPDEVANADRTHRYDGPLRVEDRSDQPNTISMIRTMAVDELIDWTPEPWVAPEGPIEKATVVRARTPHSAESRATYFVGEHLRRDDLAVVSLMADEAFLFDPDDGIMVPGRMFEEHRADPEFFSGLGWVTPANYLQRGREWERPRADDVRRAVAVDWCDPGGECPYQTAVGVRIHGGASRAVNRKSLRLYARPDFDGPTFDHDLFGGRAPQGHRRLLLRNSGNDHAATLLVDTYFHHLLDGAIADTQAAQPTVVFINGEYWGLYDLRERYDRHYLGLVHGANPDDVVMIATATGRVEAGAIDEAAGYDEVMRRAADAGPGDADALAAIEAAFDLDDFFDYLIAHVFAGNADWPDGNSRAWRQPVGPDGPGEGSLDGRWRWLVFDLDLYGGGGSRNDPTFNPFHGHMSPTESVEVAGGVPFLFHHVMADPTWRHRFLQRFADHLNSTFEPRRAVAELDAMEARLAPEIPTHVHRWQGPASVEQWRREVDALRSFMVRRPDLQRAQLVDLFDLSGTAGVVVTHDPAAGHVRVGSLPIVEGTPGVHDPREWAGTYFRGVPLTVEAVPAHGSRFSHWEIDGIEVAEPVVTITPDAATAIAAMFATD